MNPALLIQVVESAFGHFGNDANVGNWEVSQKIIERLQIPAGGDRVRVFNAVRAARRQWEDARAQYEGDPDAPIVPIGRDPTIPAGMPTYRYRVVVTVTDPDTGESYSTAVVIDSPQPLSVAEAHNRAVTRHVADPSALGRYETRGPVSQRARVEAVIISVGRS